MPVVRPDQAAQNIARELGIIGTLGLSSTLQRTGGADVEARFSFGEQVGSAFETENLLGSYFHNVTDFDFGEERGFNPAENIGRYEPFVDKFPSLLTARSSTEMAAIKNQIDREIEDRSRFENAGFWRTMAASLPAGITSPENLIPFVGGLRAFGIARAGVKTTLKARAGIVAFEGAGSQGLAEIGLGQQQGLRETQESIMNVAGATVFGAILGGAGTGIGRSRAKLLTAAIGEDNVAGAVASTVFVKALGPSGVLAAGTELGVRFRLALDHLDDLAELGDTAGEALAKGLDDVNGIMLRAISEENPRLSALLGADRAVTRVIGKMLFFNPSGRLANSPLQVANIASDITVRNAMRAENLDAAALEPLLQIAGTRLFQAQGAQKSVYIEAREILGDVTEEQFMDMAGIASRSEGKVADPEQAVFEIADGTEIDPFEKIRNNPKAIAAVEEASRQFREFQDKIKHIGASSGAFQEGQLKRTGARNLFQMLEDSYVQRIIHKDVALRHQANFDKAIVKGLNHQREKLVESGYLDRQVSSREGQIEALKNRSSKVDDALHPNEREGIRNEIQSIEAKIKEIKEIKAELLDEAGFQNLVKSVRRNYLGDSANPLSTGSQTPGIRQRVLRIEDRFLQGFLISNTQFLMARMTRSILPDLIISRRWQKYWNSRDDLSAKTGRKLEELDERLEEFQSRDEATTEELWAFQDEVEDLLSDAAIMNVADNARLLEDLDYDLSGKTRTADQLDSEVHEMGRSRKRLQRTLRKTEREESRLLVELSDENELWRLLADEHYPGKTSLANARRAAKAGTLRAPEMEELAELLKPLWDIQAKRVEIRKRYTANTEKLEVLTKAISQQNPKGVPMPAEELTVGRTRFNVFDQQDPADTLRQLAFEYDLVVDKVSDRRRASFYHNLSDAQMIRAMEREAIQKVKDGTLTADKANRALYGRGRDPKNPRPGGAVNDYQTLIARLRMRHGDTADQWRYAGKAIRDYNFTRAMGGVLISSIPDMAMAIGQAGLWNYMKTLSRFARREWKLAAETPDGRNHLAVLQWAIERGINDQRHKTNYGIESEFLAAAPGSRLSFSQRAARFSDRAVQAFSSATLIDRWNAINKGIASMAIQHRIADVATRLASGGRVKEFELGLVKSWGFTDRSLMRIAKQIANHGEKDSGRFYYAKSQAWKNRELSAQFESGVQKAVNDTIITVGAGDLSTFATKDTLGRMLMQFRNFSMAATNRMLVPALQRFWKWQDPNLAIQTAVMWMLGSSVYASNEYLKGRDPFAMLENRDGQQLGAWRKWVLEGLDRSGVLGLLTEVNASAERFGIPGLASMMGTQPASRFRSRGQFEAIVGPGFGPLFDIPAAAAGLTDLNVTQGEGAMLQRMVPYRNLFYLRGILDVGPSALMSGGNYFENFATPEERLRRTVFGE